MVEMTNEDANNYSRILAALGMDEEGDPVAVIERLRSAIGTACEGWTLPPGARKVLETALWDATPKDGGERYFPAEFEVWQDDEMVASASGPRDDALREAVGYAGQYAEDGPVRVFEVVRKLELFLTHTPNRKD